MVSEPKKILIVDDKTAIRMLLNQKLTMEGYWCEEADSAQVAIRKLGVSPTELVILDMRMPGKSGVELLAEIKSRYPGTAVIVVSGFAGTGNAVECLRQGADDYMSEPFEIDELALRIKRTLDKRELEIKVKEYQQYLEQKVHDKTVEIRQLFLGAIEALVLALEAKDRYTAGHARRVAAIALDIGGELGLSAEDMEDVRWGSLLHDVGKIAVDQVIQNKPGRLTPGEYAHIMLHPKVGARIVRPVVNQKIVDMIEHHHDRYNGSGLDQAASGEDIPLEARILAVADALDAMTSERPYRPAMIVETSLNEIRRCSGTQFDPRVVSALVKTARHPV